MYSLLLIIRQVLFFLFNGDIVCFTGVFLENALTFMESTYDDTQSNMFVLSSQEQNRARSSPQELFWKI